MKAHIDTFTRLKEERDISAPDNIGTLSTAETNLAFLASLGEPWKLFHQALGDSAHTIKTGELFAKVLAMDDSDNKPQSSDFKPLANALNTNYKDSRYSNKKKGNRSQPYNKDLNCKYCKQRGHTIEKCYKKMWADQQWNRKKKDGRKYSNSRQDSAPNFNTNNQSSSHENSTSDSPYWKANVTRYRAFQSSLHESDPHEWIVDSASNAHLTPHKSCLSNYEEFKTPRTIEGLGSHYIPALGCGDLTLTDASGNSHKLSNVIYAPDHPTAILSLSKLIFEDGIQLHILGAEDDGDFILSLPASPFLLIGHSVDNILYVNDQPKSHLTLMSKRKSPSQGSDYWHLTLGHASESRLQKLQHLIEISDTTSDCLACIRAKQHKIPHKLGHLKSKVKGELIHSDLAGPFTLSKGGSKYVITFLDDFTHYCWVDLLPNKKSKTILKAMTEWLQKNPDLKVKYLRTDGRGEYLGHLTEYITSLGVVYETTASYTPQSNGKAERLNRTLGEMVRALLFQANMPPSFWAEAMDHAAHLLNFLPSDAVNGAIPWELFTKRTLTRDILDLLHPFGCLIHAYIPRQRRWTKGKLAHRSTVGVLLSPKWSRDETPTDTYKFYDLERQCMDYTHHLTITSSFPKDGDFEESPAAPPPPAAVIPLSQPSVRSNSPNTFSRSSTPTSRSSSPSPIPPSHSPSPPPEPIIHDMIVVQAPPSAQVLHSTISQSDLNSEPVSYQDAMSRSDAEQWQKAMEDEMQSIHDNKTWTLTDLPSGRRCIGTKWVYKIKKDASNKFQRYKARIVAKGYAQVAGLDFDKTFAPVVRIDSIRLLFAISAFLGLEILHADCKTAFLNGNSDLEIYIQQPEGFISHQYPHKVLLLNKSLYGLKQAPRIWYLLLCTTIIELGFTPLETDPSIYFCPSQHILLAVYVDDILIFGLTKESCQQVYNHLSKHFKMQNLGAPTSFLGLNIVRSQPHEISINQTGYIDRILTRFQMQNAQPARTPLDASFPLLKAATDDKLANLQLYQELIGSLNHLAVFSRPDISNAVSQLSQFLTQPTETHLKAARHVLRYLKHTSTYSISYLKGNNLNLRLLGFTDANWGGDKNDRKSHTGYLFCLNGSPISWTSKKQSTVATSTMEAEYMALSDAAREAIARLQQLSELKFMIPPPLLLSDNQGALDIAENPTNFQRAKHIDIRYHFVRHTLESNQISIDYIPSSDNPADVLTKALEPAKHERCIERIGLHEI